MEHKTPTDFIKMKGLYEEYSQWTNKKPITFDKTYFRLNYWARAVSQDSEHRSIYQSILAAGYRCSIVTKVHRAKKWRVSLYKDGVIAKLYIDNKNDLCNKEFLDQEFQNSQSEPVLTP